MKALGVVVLHELPEQDAKVWLEALGSDGPDEALRAGVAVWTPCRDGDGRLAAGPEKGAPCAREQGVAVVNEMRGVTKESVRRIEQVPSQLLLAKRCPEPPLLEHKQLFVGPTEDDPPRWAVAA